MKENIPNREKSMKVRFLSALTSIMILVMTVIPNLTVSATDVSSLNNTNPTTDVKLLVGDGSPLANNTSNVDDVISNADKTYLLGIASQFCVFLQNDFTVSDADAEGRVAVGGNVEFANDWNYQIGSGDYASHTKIENLTNINGLPIYYTGASHIIAGGSYIKNINIYGSNGGSEDQTYRKIFALDTGMDINNCSKQYGSGKYEGDDLSYMYKADLIDFNSEFVKLQATSEKISQQATNGTAEVNGTTLNLTCTDPSANVVYFNIPDWNSSVDAINYINIPDGAYMVVTCDDDTISIGKDNNLVVTQINDTIISNQGGNDTNNNVNSERILYNFNNATSVYIDANFNGTIFAPNADVTSEPSCNGHLSGALIAKSFTGGLEFGYRPYQGSVNIIDPTINGYDVPVAKFDTFGNFVTGAELGLYNETGDLITSWISSGDTDYITIPTSIDFTGDTTYNDLDELPETSYTIKEISAPTGYTLSDMEYTIAITESILNVDNNGIPTQVSAMFDIETDDYSYMKLFEITTEFTDTSKVITIDNGDGDYVFSINDTNIIEGTTIVLSDISQSTIFNYADKNFYYNAENKMISPALYDDLGIDEEPISIVNDKDLIVSKVDDNGDYLSNANLQILKGDIPIKNWTSSNTFETIETSISDASTYIGNETDYFTLHETTAPDNYLIAEDINFYINADDGKLYYKNASDNSWTSSVDANLTMVDIKLTGSAVNLEKVDQDGNNLSGAIVDIYAYVDGTNDVKIASDVSLDKTNDTLVNMADVVNSNYVVGGNIKEGTYYLVETTAPTDATIITDNQYFKVNDDGTITAPYVFSDVAPTSYDIVRMAWNDESNTADLTMTKLTFYYSDGTSAYIENPIVSAGSWWHSIDISSLNSNNVIGMSIEATGTVTRPLVVQNEDGNIFGEQIAVSNGITNIGVTSLNKPSNIGNSIELDGNTIKFTNIITTTFDATISKTEIVNGVSTELSGATLTVTSKDGYDLSSVTGKQGTTDTTITINENKTSVSFVSGTEETVLSKLPAGNYTLTETTAPNGYTVAETIDFTVNVDGTISIGTETVDSVVMEDAQITATISKKDITNDTELAGATLQITSKDGFDLSNVTSSNNTTLALSEDNSTITFTSLDEATIFSKLPAGEYTLTETSAPDGYTINKTSVDFTVSNDGTITNSASISDELIKVVISKVEIVGETSKELADATLTITKLDDGVIGDIQVIRGTENVTVTKTDTSISFVTDGVTPTTFTKLPTGTYKLTETIAPNGYEIANDIYFRIDEEGNIFTGATQDALTKLDGQTIVMIDEKTPVETTTEETTVTTVPETTTKETTVTTVPETTTKETTVTTVPETTTKETTVTTVPETTTKETTTTTVPDTTTNETTTTTVPETTTKETTVTTVPETTTKETTTTTVPETTTKETTTTTVPETTTKVTTTTTVPETTTKETTTTTVPETTTKETTTTTVPETTTKETTTTTVTVPTETTVITTATPEITTTVPTETTVVTTTTSEITTTVPTETTVVTTTTSEITTTVPTETTQNTNTSDGDETTVTTTEDITTTTTVETTEDEGEDTVSETTQNTNTSDGDETTVTTTEDITTTTTVETTEDEGEDTVSETTQNTNTSNGDETTVTTSTTTSSMTTTNGVTTTNKTTSSPSTSDGGFGMALGGITVALSLICVTIKKNND